MGQYWIPVNLDKKEFVDPHRLGAGLKLWEQLAAHPGTGAALVVLTAAMPEKRGGGDLDLDENWHGPERVDFTSVGPDVPEYFEVAARTIGRWAGDRIALVGDYAQDSDLPDAPVPASKIYELCRARGYADDGDGEPWTDVSDDVAAVVEHELRGRFVGSGWRTWEERGR